jgi:hypothetical protein
MARSLLLRAISGDNFVGPVNKTAVSQSRWQISKPAVTHDPLQVRVGLIETSQNGYLGTVAFPSSRSLFRFENFLKTSRGRGTLALHALLAQCRDLALDGTAVPLQHRSLVAVIGE